MAKHGFKVLDSDMHIIEPPDLWERYMEPSFRHLAPRGTTLFVGDLGLVSQDGSWWVRDANGLQVTLPPNPNPGRSRQRNDKVYASHAERGWTSQVQLEAMDTEGLDVAAIYPSRGLLVLSEPDLDPKLAAALARAYNNWLHDFCQTNPRRLLPVAMLSVFDIADALAETKRCVQELGFKGVFLRPNIVRGRNWHDPYFDPLWSLLEELNVPVGFHEGVVTGLPQVGKRFGGNFLLRHIFSHSGEMMLGVASFCAGGVLERHPRLTVAFLEGNCSWLPHLLWRMDEHWEWLGDVWTPDVKLKPSEYFKRQCYASVEGDEEPGKYVIDWMGNKNIVFSTDYPHGDAKYPRAVEQFLKMPISDEDKRAILWDNCAHIYGVAAPVRT
jgi:predicted TIM-barrel fold metal-dependent hydrolase